MSRIRIALAVCALAATVSACQDGGSVTGPDSGPGGARFNGGMAGSGHFSEPADSADSSDGIGMMGTGHFVAAGIGAGGSGHYVEGDGGIGMAGSGHYVAGGGIGMGASGGASATSADTVSTTLNGIGMAGSGY